MRLITIPVCILCIKYVESFYNESLELFNIYKRKYRRVYSNKLEEHNAFANYARHLETVAKLNKGSEAKFNVTGIHDYNLNRYADQDSAELLERFAVTMKPYDYAANEKEYERNYLKDKKRRSIKDLNLYDLDETEDIYMKFKTKYHKSYVRARGRVISYYRFYKTLVELNNKKFNGEVVSMDANADKVHHPGEYYFDE